MGTTATSALAIALASQPGFAQTLPEGGTVTAGEADILAIGSTLLIDQVSPYAIIGFDRFDVGAQSDVSVDNGSGATLTLVTGADPSQIDGRITVTGDLFHINSNGVIIGPSGEVEAGGDIVITTLGIDAGDFMDGGDTTLRGDSGAAAVNLGRVSSLGGNVVMVANSVQNAGTISAPNGTAALAAGTEVLIRDADLGQGLIEVRAGTGNVLNTGDIHALNAELRAHDGNVMALAGNHGGVVQATGVQTRDGRVFLTSRGGTVRVDSPVRATRGTNGGQIWLNADLLDVTGTLDTSGTEGGLIAVDAGLATISGTLLAASDAAIGGRIEIGGELLDIRAGAELDASGNTGGGTIHVGGGYQGADLTTGGTIARRVLMADGATLNADAGATGDGGEVVVWSEEVTVFRGSLTARGGDTYGDGGLGEISGRQSLRFDGSVDLGAYAGAPGTLLFDPDEIVISANGTDDGQLGDSQILFADGGAYSTFYISTGEIESQLNSGTNLSLQANDTITLQAGNPITATGLGGLDLNANSSGHYIDSDITIAGDLTLTTNGVIAPGPGVTLTARDIDLDINGSITLGNLTATRNLTVTSALGGIYDSASTAITVTGSTTLTAVRDITLDNAGHDFGGPVSVFGPAAPFAVTLVDANGIDLGGINATTATITALGGDITDSGVSDVETITLVANGNDIILDSANTFGSATVNASGENLTITEADDVVLGAVTATGTLTVTSQGGGISDTATQNIAVTGDTTLTAAAGNDIVLDTVGHDFGGSVSAYGRSITLIDATAIALGDIAAVGALTVTAGGAITDTTGSPVMAATTDLNAGTADITLDNDRSVAGAHTLGVLSLTAADALVRNGGALDLGDSTLTGALDVAAGNPLTSSAATDDLSVSGAVQAQTILLNNQSTGSLDNIAINAGGSLTASGAGDAIVLVSDTLSNAGGASALDPGTGRYLLYLDDFASGFTPGGLTADALYNRTFGANPPAAITQVGNQFVFEVQPILTLTGTDTVLTYDGTGQSLTGFTVAGLVNGDTQAEALSTNPTFGSFTNAATYTSGLLSGGASDLGYAINFVQGTLTIDPRALTVGVAADDKVYDGTSAATLAFSDDRLAGDTLTFSFGGATFADENVGIDKTVTVSGITLGGADALNYTANGIATDLADITARALTVGVAADDKVYDGTAAAIFALSDDRVAGDTLTVSFGSAAFADENAGTDKTVTVSDITLSGVDALNYTVSGSATDLADITPRDLTVGVAADDKVFDGNTDATFVLTDDALTDDIVTISFGGAAFADENAGSDKTVTVAGITLGGADALNYTVNGVATDLADITPRDLTVGVAADNKVYDGTTSATVTFTNDSLAGDTVLINFGTAAFADANAGNDKTVTVTGITLSGADTLNYTANGVATDLADITPRGLTISSDLGLSKLEGAEDPILTFTLTEGALVDGDTLNGALTREPGEVAGNYAIGLGNLEAGTNYVLNFEGADLMIVVAPPPVIEEPQDDVIVESGPTLVLLENAQAELQGIACTAASGSGTADEDLRPIDPIERALRIAAGAIQETSCD